MQGKKLKELVAQIDDNAEVRFEMTDGLSLYHLEGVVSGAAQFGAAPHSTAVLYLNLPKLVIRPEPTSDQ